MAITKRQFTQELLEWFAPMSSSQKEWAEALVAASLDECQGDYEEALSRAKTEFARDPEGKDKEP